MSLTAVVAMAGILLLLSAGTAIAQQNAIVVFNVGGNGIAGTVTFSERAADCAVAIVGSISGLRPSAAHGLHVHEYGDVSNGCNSIGGHWNPLNTTHGDLDADPSHAGDLGNIHTDGAGVALVNLTSRSIARVGFAALLGRTLAVHNGTDDLGLGNASSSRVNGNSGARLSCGVIGVAIGGGGSPPATTAAATSCGGTSPADQKTASASAQSSNAAATVPSSAASVAVTSLPTEANSAGQSSSGNSASTFGSSSNTTSTMSNTSSGYGGNSTSTSPASQPSIALSVSWSSASSASNAAHCDGLTNLASLLSASLVLGSYLLSQSF